MSVKQPPLFLTDNIKMDRIPTKIKWKIHALFALGYSKKKKTNRVGRRRGVEDILFLKNPWNFSFFTLFLEIRDKFVFKVKLNPWKFHKIVSDPSEIPRPKTKTPLEIPHCFFFFTLGNPTSFLGNPQKIHMLFLWYPWP